MQEIYDTAVALLFALDAYVGFRWWVEFSAATWIALLVGRFLYNVYFGVALGAARAGVRSRRPVEDMGIAGRYLYDDRFLLEASDIKSLEKGGVIDNDI